MEMHVHGYELVSVAASVTCLPFVFLPVFFAPYWTVGVDRVDSSDMDVEEEVCETGMLRAIRLIDLLHPQFVRL